MQGKSAQECVDHFLSLYKPFSEQWCTSGERLYHENIRDILSVWFAQNALARAGFKVVLAIEKQLKVEIYREPGLRVYVSDKSDGLITLEADGSDYSMEHKTGEWIDANFFHKFSYDPQVIGHIYAARKSGYDVKGVYINAIQFNKLPEKLAKKCKTCKIPQADCWPQHVKWAQQPITHSQADIDMWERQIISSALNYYRVLVECKQTLEGVRWLPMEGMLARKCFTCEMRPYCWSHKENANVLAKREREEGVMYSGLYEVPEE